MELSYCGGSLRFDNISDNAERLTVIVTQIWIVM